MNSFGVDVRKIASVSAVLTLLIFAAILIMRGENPESIVKSLLKGGAALSGTGLFWTIYNKWGWRTRGCRLFGWLSPLPDLNGRWEGTVCRTENDAPRPFVIEITQTFTRLSFMTFSRHSQGRSAGVVITSNEEKNVFGAIAFWQTTTKAMTHPNDDTFSGTSVWSLIYIDNPGDRNDKIKIVDKYYTSRTPPTSDRVEVRRVGRKLRNGFE